ncbi:metallophosphoesterase [Helicobacter sp. MIT 21-1697]|uniref:metallophosphoesterase n=1 Tax=Helicobacter sp. MIT 21-1697 TaxID=2993733 RepID=UPI00224A4CE1|nr:metallophosphoesterase [Helicobacter sp. MIT 21-1697]MCX2716404.1 metallophosphoesterase [Helicobacter sp. MIT 21-1697]
MQDIPHFAQMQNAIFPFIGSFVFIVLHIYIYKALLKSLSAKLFVRFMWKIFTYFNAISCIAYLFLRNSAYVPQVIYFLLSLCLGITFLFAMAAFLYQCCSIIIITLRTKSARARWRHRTKVSILLLTLIVLVFGTYNGAKKPDIVHINIELEGLNTPIKAAVLSDVHIGGLMEESKVKQIVKMTNELNADMIFLIGDIVDAPLKNVQNALKELKNLRANEGIFYVLGNHEYFHDVENILKELKSFGFHILVNQNYTLKNTLNIVGIADFMGWRVGYLEPNIDEAFKNIDPHLPTILLAHQPKIIDYLKAPYDKVDLVVSGHTHGGQIFPFSLAMLLQQPFISELHTLKNLYQTKVYVSQGTGFWGPPMRIGSKHEITLLELVPPR